MKKRNIIILILLIIIILLIGYSFLRDSIKMTGNVVASTNFKGYISSVYNDKIPGWACDSNNPSERLAIHLYFDRPADGNSNMIMLANLSGEQAIGNLCGGDSQHRFAFDIPSSLKDGQSHQIYAYAVKYQTTSEVFQLIDSPITYRNAPCLVEFLQDRTFEDGFIGRTFSGRFPTNGEVLYRVGNKYPFWRLMELNPANYFIDNLPQPKSTSPQIIFKSANNKKQLISNKDGSLRFLYDSSTEQNHGNSITPPTYANTTDWVHYGLSNNILSLKMNDFYELKDHIGWNISKAKNLYYSDSSSKGAIFNNAYLFHNSNPNGWSSNPTQPKGIYLTLEVWTKDLDSGGLNLVQEGLGSDQTGVPIYHIPVTQITAPQKGIWKNYDIELVSLAKKAVDYYNSRNDAGFTLNYNDLILVESSHHTEIWGGLELDWTIRNWSFIGIPKTSNLCAVYSNRNIKGYMGEVNNFQQLGGWTCNSLDSSNLNYKVFIDNIYIGEGTANILAEQAVCNECGGSCNHRFAFSIPQNYFDNSNHRFDVYAIYNQIQIPLYDSPKTIYLNRISSPTCTSFNYSSWTTCNSSALQSRTITSSNPNGCTGGTPQSLIQQCSPPCTLSNWQSTDSVCLSSNTLTRTWTKIGNCNQTIGISKSNYETISCNYTPNVITCTNFTYSNWSECFSNGIQNRSLTNSSPTNCQAGNPILTQACNYTAQIINPDITINPNENQGDNSGAENNNQETDNQNPAEGGQVTQPINNKTPEETINLNETNKETNSLKKFFIKIICKFSHLFNEEKYTSCIENYLE